MGDIMGDKLLSLVNSTRSRTISAKVRYASTPFAKFRGLMFRKKLDYALVFPAVFPGRINLAIHMFFVFFPIDVLYLRKNRVVDLRKNVAPFTPYICPASVSDTLVEIPAGTIARSRVSIGDRIEFKRA